MNGAITTRNDKRLRIYPEYLDKNLTRSEGRRIRSKIAIEKPSLLEIKIAAQKLGFDVETDAEMAYSKRWFEPRGMLFLSKEERLPKNQLLKELSKTIRDYSRPVLLEKQKELLEKQKQPQKKKPSAQQQHKKATDKKVRRRRR